MGTCRSEEEIHEEIAVTLVQMGFEKDAALVIVDTVMTATENASLSAMITVEMVCNVLKEPVKLMAQHLTLQILIGRLTSFLQDLDKDLLATGAKRHVIFSDIIEKEQHNG